MPHDTLLVILSILNIFSTLMYCFLLLFYFFCKQEQNISIYNLNVTFMAPNRKQLMTNVAIIKTLINYFPL